MKRKKRPIKRAIKKKNTYFKNLLENLKERLLITISIALVSWITGALTNNVYTSETIDKLKANNKTLDKALSYYLE